MLALHKSVCIHHQNTQWLLIEIYKALHDNSENSLKELFVKRESTINSRSKPELVIPSVNSIHDLKTFDKRVKNVEKLWDFCLPVANFYAVYVDWSLHDCFITFVMYILDVFIARMGLGYK